jgi:hypothetical protein
VLEKDPLSYEVATWLWVCGLSFLGGLASYVRKIKTGLIQRFSVMEILGEMVISGFVGILTFFLCESSHAPPMLSAAIIGISSHMGSRAIFIFETAADNAFQRWVGKKYEDN